MSALIVPALAIGGVYLLYSSVSRKNKHKNKHVSSSLSSLSKSKSSSSSSSSSSKTKKHSSPDYVKTKKHRKHKKTETTSALSDTSYVKTKKHRSRRHKHETIRELAVYYTYGSVKGKTWTYNNLPSGWSLKKKNDTKSSSRYTKMVVFSGPKSNRDEVNKYLNKAFEYLKKKHIVKHYKITSGSHL
jgi:hypothetical protein